MAPDTIVALSTPRGRGAVAVVRISGTDAREVLDRVAPSPGPGEAEPREVRLASIVDPSTGDLVDRALVTRFEAPASYTGEDVVEIACHGGFLVPALVLDACVAAGARLAEPGEFSRRAYLNGKLDLVQVEAVADLIEAKSRALHRASLVHLERGLSARVASLRERLIRAEALLAHHLDFPEEDDAPVPLTDVVAEAERVLAEMDGLLRTAPEGAMLREGALVVLAGAPNAGKSSLYNALIGEERAMVTEVPGTTRDALESTFELGGFPFRLVDTAGLRDSDERLERMGIEVAKRELTRADLVLFCTEEDGLGPAFEAVRDEVDVPIVVVRTKSDLRGGEVGLEGAGDGAGVGGGVPGGGMPGGGGGVPGGGEGEPGGGGGGAPREGVGVPGGAGAREALVHPAWEREGVEALVSVSVRTGDGVGQLRQLLPRAVFSGLIETAGDTPIVTRTRQLRALTAARAAVVMFRDELVEGVPADLAATHLRPAESALEELLGIISVDDVLDVVFSSFCIGK